MSEQLNLCKRCGTKSGSMTILFSDPPKYLMGCGACGYKTESYFSLANAVTAWEGAHSTGDSLSPFQGAGCGKPKRKIVQICFGIHTGGKEAIFDAFALCNDGTTWESTKIITDKGAIKKGHEWKRSDLPEIPQDTKL